MEMAIKEGCDAAEQQFMAQNKGGIVKDKSGSCAIICIITDNKVYVANVGDSRAIIQKGQKIEAMSRDHKPSDKDEQKRIMAAGGSVYQNANVVVTNSFGAKIEPPHRVVPGRLSVSRSFGDC